MKPLALLTTIPSDSHNWNLIFVELFLEEHGFKVINLGPCVPYDMLLNACRKQRPDLLVVSTINGHGYIEGKELIRRVSELDCMQGKPAFIGGKLSTDENMSSLYAVELEQAGYTKAHTNDVDMKAFAVQLQRIMERFAINKQA